MDEASSNKNYKWNNRASLVNNNQQLNFDTFVTYEKFDSEILRISTARLLWQDQFSSVSESIFNAYYQEKKIDCIFMEIPLEDIYLCMPEKRNYQFISTKITYDAEAVSINNSSTNHIYRLAPIDYNNYENYWLDMVRDLSQTSHYARDLKIGAEKALLLYKRWFENSINGYVQKHIAVYDDVIPCGFITLKESIGVMTIDLLVVHNEFRGKGIAHYLMEAACSYAIEKNKKLQVSTQIENYAANRLYQKYGLRVRKAVGVFHKFLK